jgi:hypothetical protein
MTGSNGEEDTDERREDEHGSSGGTSETSTCRKKQHESSISRKINYEQQLLDILKEKSESTDEDKTFLLHLVPGFKKLNDDQKYWAKMRRAKTMVFQPQYVQCFTATTSLPQAYDYNLQYQNTSTMSNIPNKRTVNSPTVSDALSNQSSDF